MPKELRAINTNMTECLFDLIKQGASVRQLQLVLESEMSLEVRNDRQETPLMAAMLNIHDPMKREKTLLLFIEFNTNINCINSRGQTPLMYACILNQTVEMRILLNEPRLDCNIRDFEGNTALMYACAIGKIAAIETLVEANCDKQIQLNPYIMNYEGTSAFDYARDNPDDTILKLLGRLMTEDSVYHYDQEAQNELHPIKAKSDRKQKKSKGGKTKRIHQLAGDVKASEVFISDPRNTNTREDIIEYPTAAFDNDSMPEPLLESEKPSRTENKIPKKKSFIMNIHLPKTYEDDDHAMTKLTEVIAIDERTSMSRSSKFTNDDQIPSTSGIQNNSILPVSSGMPSTSRVPSTSDLPSALGIPSTPIQWASGMTSGSRMPSTPDMLSNQRIQSTPIMAMNSGTQSTSCMTPTSGIPSTSGMPSTSGLPCEPHPPESSRLKGKQRKRRKGKRTRNKKRTQTAESQASDLPFPTSKPVHFGEEIAVCNKIYGADLYPCSGGPDETYNGMDKIIAKVKLKVADYTTPCLNDRERIMKAKLTGKMDCMQLSASERAKLLSRTIWSVYGAPLPPIPISLPTVHRVMSGISRLRQYLGKAKYQPGRLLNLDPEMWCIVESIKHEKNLQEHSVMECKY